MENSLHPITSLVKDTWAFYTSHFNKLVGFLLPVAVFFVVSGIIEYFGAPGFLVAILKIVGVVWGIIVLLIQMRVIGHLEKGEDFSQDTKVLYTSATRYFLPYVFISICTMFIGIGAAVPFVIPVLILSVYFAFTQYALMVDDHRGMQAIVHSVYYVKNFWWKTFGRLFFLNIFFSIPLIIITLVGIVLSPDYSATNEAHPIAALITSVVSLLFSAPLLIIMQNKLYAQLKAAKPAPTQENLDGIQGIVRGLMIWGIIVSVAIVVFSILLATK